MYVLPLDGKWGTLEMRRLCAALEIARKSGLPPLRPEIYPKPPQTGFPSKKHKILCHRRFKAFLRFLDGDKGISRSQNPVGFEKAAALSCGD
jgi:hypothetical protein